MKIDVYTDPGVFRTLESEWNATLESSVHNTIFGTLEWAEAWWMAYEPGTLWVLTFRDEANDRLLGIAPWFIETNPEQGRIVRCIGSEDVTDYLDVIMHQDATETLYACLTDTLVNLADHYDEIGLCNIPEESPSFHLFPEYLKQRGFDVSVSQMEVCPIIELPGEWELYLEGLNKKQRHELRRKLRRAEGQQPQAPTWYIVDESHDIEAEMDRFLHLMGKSDPQKASFLENAEHVAFFRGFVPVALSKGWLQMNFLVMDDTSIAAYLNFIYGDSVLVYNSGLDHEQYGHLSPGIVLLCYNIQHAIEHGRKVFDFLRGNETYKYRMGAEDTAVYQLSASLKH